jgi:hypothetical protein
MRDDPDITKLQELLSNDQGIGGISAVSFFLRNLADGTAALSYFNTEQHRHPEVLFPYIFLIQLHTWNKRPREAETMFRQMLANVSDIGIEDIQTSICKQIDGAEVLIETKYRTYPESVLQNLGFLEHAVSNGPRSHRFITKICTQEFIGNEWVFYEAIAPQDPSLLQVVPKVVHMARSKTSDLHFMTMEMLDGHWPDMALLDQSALDSLVNTYRAVSGVDKCTVQDLLLVSPLAIEFNHGFLVQAFQSMHTREGMALVNDWLLEAIQTRGYDVQVARAVSDLITLMNNVHFYRHIDPNTHYGFLHGDLHRHNILQVDNHFRFLDWARCAIGPSCIDLAVLMRRLGFAGTIKVLERNGLWAELSSLNQVMFAHALIVVSVMIDIEPIKREPPEALFLPAARFAQERLSRI